MRLSSAGCNKHIPTYINKYKTFIKNNLQMFIRTPNVPLSIELKLLKRKKVALFN